MSLVDYNLPVKVPSRLVEEKAEAISQGAEALVFALPSKGTIAKYRPPKPWRLPELDAQLRKRRTTQESRVLKKLAGFGVSVPELLDVDLGLGLISMEMVPGRSLKAATRAGNAEDGTISDEVRKYYEQLGSEIARMHAVDIVHGDLTTSNAMVTPEGKIVLIDFGLSSQDANAEDKAVDLYVLERAINSTHPQEASKLVSEVLMPSYTQTGKEQPKSKVDQVLTRLEAVRRRGRKRTQLG